MTAACVVGGQSRPPVLPLVIDAPYSMITIIYMYLQNETLARREFCR